MSEPVRRRRTALLAAGAAVLLTAVAVAALLLGGRGGTSTPAILHLALTAAPRADAALASSGTSASGSGYELVGTLPTEAPDTPAYAVASRAAATAVQRLAEALGAGAPQRAGDGWRTPKGLVVNGDGSWWWSTCPDGVVSSDGVRSGCATSGGATGGGTTGGGTTGSAPGVVTPQPGSAGGAAPGAGSGAGSAEPGSVPPATAAPVPKGSGPAVPVPPSPLPTADEDTVLSTAGPVLAAVGLDVGNARVDGAVAVVDPVVGGLPTWGLSTRVAVSADGQVSDASGWLVSTSRGDTYPIRTARETFAALPPLPRPMIACPVGPSGQGCPEPQPVQVTGARRGLALQWLSDGGHVLAPAWLFTVRGWSDPLPGLAVPARYVDTGAGPTTRPAPSGDPGTPVPAPSAVAPVPPSR